ncbi:dihydroorotate dehydrogenase electron transfer subunit [Eubacteriales bacterium OttesenSCG-928-A19]|nr:dihydroorotate dehydrogenase electron transfer subunit [Eubacteriales bacterium OttesenSCG-928-A19]
MTTQDLYPIEGNERIARDVYEMRLAGDTSALARPGQFVNIRLDGLYLRRPISVCSYDGAGMTLIYKVVGKGTARMAAMRPGEALDLLVGLGNGFDAEPARGRRIALVGGGVGLPPLYGLMEALRGEDVTCVMGFRAAEDVFYAGQFEALGARVIVTTEDGTRGLRGRVTDALAGMEYDYYFACGPEPMLRGVHALGGEGQLSFEERMGCGFGACMGCACRTLTGYKRICKDGPVLHSGEVAF